MGGQAQVRISFKKPAAQTDPPPIQACIASRFGPDGRIVTMDLAQIELRIQALCSGDAFLLPCFRDHLDPHAERAVQFEGESVRDNPHFGSGDARVDPRQWYKIVNYLIGYRGKAAKLQSTLLDLSGRLFPLSFCMDIVNDVPLRSPELWQWQEEMIEQAHSQGYIEVPFIGVSRSFMGGEKFDENEIVNVLPQSLAAGITHRIQANVERYIPWRSPCPWRPLCFLNKHDGIYWDCPSEESSDWLVAQIEDSVDYVRYEGLWSWLLSYYGNEVPLEYEVEVKCSTSPR